MYTIVYLIVLVGVFSAVFSKDIADRFEGRPEENPELFEGDIRLTPEQRAIIEAYKSGQRKATSDLALRWRNAVVPCVISSRVGSKARAAIISAMDHWKKRTCVKFIRRTDQVDYIEFVHDVGCWSSVGRIGKKQKISIGIGCEEVGKVIHEIGHAIGFFHEQSRPDRDNFITVHWENIEQGYEHNFEKMPLSAIVTHSVPYDVGSIMHYDKDSYSKNDQPTITAKNSADNDKMGQRTGLSDADIQLANAIFGCVDCTDGNISCPGLADAGECFTNKDYMLENCKRSCSVCHGYCHDDDISCPWWASHNECDLHPDYMLVNCKRSCNVCIGLACTDEHPSCASWAAIDGCVNNPEYMLTNCKRSCKVC